jgi:hypothetical protein
LFGGRVKTLASEYKLGTGKDFNYAGHNLSRFAPKEEAPQQPAGLPPQNDIMEELRRRGLKK